MSSARPSVAVLANCTHASIAATLRQCELFGKVQSFELYSLAPDLRSQVADELAGFDHILTIEHGESFLELSTAALRERFTSKVYSLPTPFFSGWQPDMAYLTNRGAFSDANHILGDYHSGLILAECQAGLSEQEVVERYVNGEAFERIDLQKIWNDSLSELRTREAQTDLRISDYIEAHSGGSQVFMSFNHPTEGLIRHIVQEFVNRVLGRVHTIAPLPIGQHNLYQDAFWPVHPVVANALNLKPSINQMFKSPNRFGAEWFSIEEFARRSYRFFSIDNAPDNLAVLTPSYLQSNLILNQTLQKSKKMPSTKNTSDTFSTSTLINVPPKEIVLTHFGRSGSTVLAKMLGQHSHIGWLNEIFSLEWIRSSETYNFTLKQLLDLVADGSGKVRTTAPDAVVGHEIKLMNFLQNPSCNMVDYAAETLDQDRYLHVVLRRRNILRRIFSVYKAMTTKVYHVDTLDNSHAEKTYSVNMANLFDPDTGQTADTLPELLEKAQAREDSVLQNYKNLGLNYLLLTYEDDIEMDPRQAYYKILDYAGLEREEAQILLNKTSRSLQTEVKNFSEVKAALAGTRFEWMIN